MSRDRQQVAASCEAVAALDFDRLIMAHGDIVEQGAPEALRRGMRWTLPVRGRARALAA